MRGLFVVGTGTGVGKTIVSAGLAWALRRRKIDVGVMKPFATSSRIFSDKYRSADVAMLARAAHAKEEDVELNPVFYKKAAAPLVAAELTSQPPPVLEQVLRSLKKLASKHEFTIVEGIGGVLVPLTHHQFVADFAQGSELPLLIVTTPVLGTMNHTLLTVEACRKRRLQMAGLVVNMMPKNPSPVEKSTPDFLAKLAKLPVLGTIPLLTSPNYLAAGKAIEASVDIEALISLH
jgi:dethiobiotin synthetase